MDSLRVWASSLGQANPKGSVHTRTRRRWQEGVSSRKTPQVGPMASGLTESAVRKNSLEEGIRGIVGPGVYQIHTGRDRKDLQEGRKSGLNPHGKRMKAKFCFLLEKCKGVYQVHTRSWQPYQ